MSRPLRIQYPNAYYHVTCRGNARREIFRMADDREDFLRLLSRSANIFDVQILVYALMPNHFHLLVCTPKGNLSEFMRHFNISYTGAFNRKYNRSGHLYQGRYKAFLIDEDNYLLEVSRYIHLNPLKMKSKKPAEQRWRDLVTNESTSFPGYLHQKDRKPFVHYKTVLNYFGGDHRKSANEYKKFVAQGMERDLPNPLEKGKGIGIVGNDDFVKQIKDRFKKDKRHNRSFREQPSFRVLERKIRPDDLIDQYAKMVNIAREEVTRRGKHSLERSMLMEMLYRLSDMTQPEIGKLFGGIDYSAVSQARKRLQLKIERDPELGMKVRQIQDALAKCQE